MISSREDLNSYLAKDMPLYASFSRRERFLARLTRDPLYELVKYVRFLRYEEYCFNTGKGKWSTACYLFCLRQKNKLGNRLGIKIPRNTCGPGLMIYHHGGIIINEKARLGANASLHGANCIGNDGKTDDAPVIGDNLDLGIGAMIIGGVQLGDRVRVGANAVVTGSFPENDITLAGIPAQRL